MKKIKGKYFYGNKISEYGLQHGYVDYGTLAKAFDCVLNNEIMHKMEQAGYFFKQVSGFVDNSEKIEELENKLQEFDFYSMLSEEEQEEYNKIEEEIKELENEQEEYVEIYQYYIVDDNGAELLQEINEIVFYCEELDLYIWGVTHWGTSWDYVLTNIIIEVEE